MRASARLFGRPRESIPFLSFGSLTSQLDPPTQIRVAFDDSISTRVRVLRQSSVHRNKTAILIGRKEGRLKGEKLR